MYNYNIFHPQVWLQTTFLMTKSQFPLENPPIISSSHIASHNTHWGSHTHTWKSHKNIWSDFQIIFDLYEVMKQDFMQEGGQDIVKSSWNVNVSTPPADRG